MGNSLAIIEVVGMVTAIQVGDIAVKAANVELLGYELTKGSGFVIIKLKGDVGSVKAAVDAVLGTLGSSQKLVGHIVIPRPSEGVEKLLNLNGTDEESGEENSESEKERSVEKKEVKNPETKEEKPVKKETSKEQPAKKKTTRAK